MPSGGIVHVDGSSSWQHRHARLRNLAGGKKTGTPGSTFLVIGHGMKCLPHLGYTLTLKILKRLILIAFTRDSLNSENPTLEQIHNLYTTYTLLGPVARTCLATVSATSPGSDYRRLFRSYVLELDQEIHRTLLQMTYPSLAIAVTIQLSHKLALMIPSEDHSVFNPEIMTRWIAFRVASVADDQARYSSYQLYKSLSKQTVPRTSAGWLFEAFAHQWLRQGGKFQADKLPVRAVNDCIKFTINKSRGQEEKSFTSPGHLYQQVKNRDGNRVEPKMIGEYFQPWGQTQESFDGLVIENADTLILFQITIALRHDIKTGGVKSILNALPATIKKIRIVFTIPEDKADKYTNRQSVPRGCDLGPRAAKCKVEQFRLVFNDKAVESVALHPSRRKYAGY